MSKGKLIRVELSPGRIVKMYEADAVAQGLIPAPEAKAQPPATRQRPKPGDKQRLPQEDKDKAPEPVEEPAQPEEQDDGRPQDDFTTIPGVGPATARALAASGITTFAQLRTAGELDYLTATVNAAIEEWRKHG